MVRRIVNNIFVKSFLRFVLLTALVHIGVLVIKTVKEGDIKLLNYFSILDLNSFFPKIINGWWSDVISLVIMLLIFFVFFTITLIRKAKIKIEK